MITRFHNDRMRQDSLSNDPLQRFNPSTLQRFHAPTPRRPLLPRRAQFEHFERAGFQSFAQAVELGRRVIWLHTFGERFADRKADRPPGPPRLPKERAPHIPD